MNHSKRVLIFLPCLTNGGAEKQGVLLAHYLHNKGYAVQVWGFPSPTGHAPLISKLIEWGIDYKEISAWPILDWSKQTIFPLSWSFFRYRTSWRKQLANYRNLLLKETFDYIFAFTFWPCLVSILFKHHFGEPIVFWIHRGGFDAAGMTYSRFIIREIKAKTPIFVANSEAGAKFLSTIFKTSLDNITIISNAYVPGYDVSADIAPRAQSAGKINLLHVANLYSEKDPVTLIDSAYLLKEWGYDFHLRIAGDFPVQSDRDTLATMIINKNLGDFVTLLGGVSRFDLLHLLRTSDIGLLSSRSEGMPNCIMEYMYWRLPVIATNIAGICAVVGKDNEKWLYPVGDSLALARLVKILADHRELIPVIGDVNREIIMNNFNAELIMKKWDELINAH